MCLLCRFLLCNQTTLPPVPRVPFRQHSASLSATATSEDDPSLPLPASSSSPSLSQGGGEGGAEAQDGGAAAERKLNKAVSMEDEAARLTIEVCRSLGEGREIII